MLNLTNSKGQPQTVTQWVADMMQKDRTALYEALVPFMGPSSGPASLEKIRADFARLSREDCMAFIDGIQQGIAIAETAVIESELDAAINADLARRKGQKAVDDARAASIADAKAKVEQAAKEVV